MRALIGNRSCPPLDELIRRFGEGASRLAAGGLAGGSAALILAALLHEFDGPALVLAAGPRQADALLDDLAFFLRAGDGSASPRLHLYPAYDVAPFESISPHPTIVGRRAKCLAELAGKRRPIIVAPIEAAMNRVLTRQDFAASRQVVNTPDLFERDALAADLMAIGYRLSPIVEEVGELAVRGGILDVYSPAHELPVRIELFGDEVESIRLFDPSSQTSRKNLRQIELYSCGDVHLGKRNAELFAERLKRLADEQDVPKPRRDRLVDEVTHRMAFPGIEFFTPLLHERLDALTDHLGAEGLVVLYQPDETESALEAFADKVRTRFGRAREAGKLCAPPEALYLDADGLRAALAPRRQLAIGREAHLDGAATLLFDAATHGPLREQILLRSQADHMLAPLVDAIERGLSGEGRAILVSRTPGGADRLEGLLKPYRLPVELRLEASFDAALSGGQGLARAPILLGGLSAGFTLPDLALTVITEEDVFGERRRTEAYAKRQVDMLGSLAELAEGDFVVHVKHGVGAYRGLARLAFGGTPGEFLHIEYAGGDKLYLPVDRLGSVQRYVGAGTAPKIDRLGGTAWQSVKSKARKAARQLAKELLAVQAARAAAPGFAFPPPDATFHEFEATFPYEETPDQATAIQDAIADLTADRPADRLICGDVGFGKTEVALRAAFLAAQGGKQVAVLAPTTTLAFQHYNTFQSRMAQFGVTVGMLSRFTEPNEKRETLKRLAAGGLDVVVGTHMLLGKAVQYKDLGLLVVDEEQHFGVAQKEKIKNLAKHIDVLTFTATPIPRTLHMSLAGIRDMSVINTPPEDRLAIRTLVTRWDEDTIREALERELARGGQAFFIHNRVKSLDDVASRLRRLLPQARLGVGHGQMDEKRLEQLMIDFAEGLYDILVCTTIVESGLDFPRANTIVIDRADALGLSQLYQLRGRVGRSKRRAYCYLLVPPTGAMSADARKRLAVLRTFTELGSGYKIAARDLEIRGAGNLLGAEQSGHIGAVGYDLYVKLLEEEIARLKGEPLEEPFECEVAVRLPAYLPEEYVAEPATRLALYKRIADARGDAELANLRAELTDRFGRLPPPAVNLLAVVGLRRKAEALRIKKIEAGAERIAFEFDDDTPVTAARLVQLVAANPKTLTLSPEGKLYQKTAVLPPDQALEALAEGLQRLSACAK